MRFPFDSYEKLYPRESKNITNPNIIEKMVETIEPNGETNEPIVEPTEPTEPIVEPTEPSGGKNGD